MGVTAHDPAGGNLSCDWLALDGGAVVGSGADVVFDPPDTGPHPCPYRVEVTVTSDASGLSTTQIVEITAILGGDCNGDGPVNVLDRLIVRNNFGMSPPDDPEADVNCDGNVNVLDRIVVRNQFSEVGCSCPAP